MIIDERIIENGISVATLSKLIRRHQSELDRYTKLRNYYEGEHAITRRKRQSSGVANNKIVCNHAKYVVDMAKSYLVGNAVSYTPMDDYDIDEIKNAYLAQDIASLDTELVKSMGIYGKAYELVYSDAEGQPRSAYLSPDQAFVVYNDDATHDALFGVHYYKTYNLDGVVTGVTCEVYDTVSITTYAAANDNWDSMTMQGMTRHYFGGVPLIEYDNNGEKQGDFEQIIPLIDAYNLLMSDRVNDKEQFVDAFLFMTGIDIDSEQAKKLKEEKILMGFEGATAQYLNKIMTENDIEVLRNNLKDDIHRFSMVPDLSDDSFGNNLSGVAIKYKLLGFEQNIKNKERQFAKSLKTRFVLYNSFLTFKGAMEWVPIHKIDIVFTRNLPVNNLETAQMINNLSGMATPETLLGQLDFIKDPEAEAERARDEAAESLKRTKEVMDVRDYNSPIKTSGEDDAKETK